MLENDQDMTRLAGRLRDALAASPAAHAVLLSGHGLYTWGRTIAEAERHVEILEFLLEVVGRAGGFGGAKPPTREEGKHHGSRQDPG